MEKLTAAGVPYTGDKATDEVLDSFPDILERIKRLESGKEETISLEELAAKCCRVGCSSLGNENTPFTIGDRVGYGTR